MHSAEEKKQTPKETTQCLTDRDRNHPYTTTEREEAPGPARAFSWPKLNHPREIPFPHGIKPRLPPETLDLKLQTSETHAGIFDRHLDPFWALA